MNEPQTCITLYFGDRAVHITADAGPAAHPAAAAGSCRVVTDMAQMPDSPAKIAKILESCESLILAAGSRTAADALFERLRGSFDKVVAAAGGAVENGAGEVLMIYRRGRWDLPKGHIEEGETPAACAVRETEEETGVRGAKIACQLCNTWHAYDVYGVWELKNTFWYAMTAPCGAPLQAQTDEGILRAEWCTPAQVQENLRGTYPTIRRVFECRDVISKTKKRIL